VRIIEQDIPLKRERLDIKEAIEFFSSDEQLDKVRLLQWREFSYFDVYKHDGYMDYFYGEMAPSTGYVQVFELHYMYPGMIILFPDKYEPEKPAVYRHSPKLASVFAESDSFTRLMHCANVAELNAMTTSGSVRELVRINEALHEKSYANLADKIVQRNVRAVLLAGPSSSGKTSSANRLFTQLRVLGKNPVMLSLDDYYIDRDKIPYDENGEQDLEHVETLDIEQFRSDLELLIAGERVEIPEFNFLTGRRKTHGRFLQVGSDEPMIIEGIHGLNPILLSPAIPRESIFRVYVSALTTLSIDDHNRIRTTDVRLLRRRVRDYEMRGAAPERTLSMWQSVRRGEEKWIFPFQEEADAFFNTALVYEIAVLKKHIYPLLVKVDKKSPYFATAHELIKFLHYFADAHVEDEVPPTSILREFIGGSAFFRKDA
jgi:uridine kinase